MRRSIMAVTVVIVAVSLVGIIATQLFWMNNTLELQKKQFSHRVHIALQSVHNRLLKLQNDSLAVEIASLQKLKDSDSSKERSLTSGYLLDSLLKKQFFGMDIGNTYHFGVYNTYNNHFVAGRYKNFEQKILASPYKVSLSGVDRPDQLILAVFLPEQEGAMIRKASALHIFSVVFVLFVIFSFTYTLYTFHKQKKLSEIKADFINNMTHEFKTPISTISLASEMLQNPDVIDDYNKIKKYSDIIYTENTRLKNQVEHVLQIAILDRKKVKIKKEKINIHELIEKCIENAGLLIKQAKGDVATNFMAIKPVVMADPIHVTNIITNMLDNAIKYTEKPPRVRITTANTNDGIIISIEDNGLGINHEDLKHVFKRFYRVPTGNLHNVKGFGLGLYYVKTMVQSHGGTIDVQSMPGKGSCFDLFFPFEDKNEKTSQDGSE